MSYSHQVVDLAQPFPEKFVHRNPSGGGSYIKHHVINQRLIQVFGRPPTFKLVEVIRGDVAALEANPKATSKRGKEGSPALTNVVVAVIARLEVGFGDEWVVVEEAGDCEEPHNWKTDGQRLKDAMSDAYKRCAMRLGCGLHLWSQDEYFLHDELLKAQPKGGDSSGAAPAHTPPLETGDAVAPDSSQGSSERGRRTPEIGGAAAVAPDTRRGDSTAPATSQERGSGREPSGGQGAGPSSSWERIEEAIKGGLSRGKVTSAARVAAASLGIPFPTKSVTWDDVLDLPEEAHNQMARDLLDKQQETLV